MTRFLTLAAAPTFAAMALLMLNAELPRLLTYQRERRWEKVLFARKYRELQHSIETAHERLALAREEETTASARVAEVESQLGALRIEQAEARLEYSRRPETDMEVCSAVQSIESFARGEGVWRKLSEIGRAHV